MPWHVEKRNSRFCVIKDADGENEGCHDTREEANRHMAALYANENEAATGLTFEDAAEEIAASFSVNIPHRTILGLMVPWGKVAKSGFSKWRFGRGSLHWSSDQRVKLNLGHDHAEAVGVATRIDDGAAGLIGTFKIARGEAGDRALSLAEDGVMDGFSIEVDFDEEDGWIPDPSNEKVRLVQRGRLAGVALTAFPAFDDARVERVAAARKGVEMANEEQAPAQMDAGEAEATFETALERLAGVVTDNQVKNNEQLAQSIGESVSAGFKAALEDISASSGPGSVKAARYSVSREEPVYRFDGSGDSLVRDAWAAARDKDEDAIERLRKYRKQTEEVTKLFSSVAFSPQTTSTASQIIPPGYRPDLYVSDLFKGRPFVNAASKGTIPNATPFTVPVFSSVTTGSADHVEGTNPSDGSLSFATKTVTPQAISGRLVLSRELVDSSNPAIDQIAIAEMRESYARQTETKVYTLLNGANGAGGTITGDLVPSGSQASTTAKGTDNQTLVKHIRERLAKYYFNRFDGPDVALMGSAATVLLANAVDTTQRPLFPYIGPNNAVGTGNAATQGWNVDGLAFVPAWANTGTAAGDSQIMIIKSSDLWVWESPLLTFRFEEKQGPANIEMNIFGYFGTHLLRPVGLSGIRIT